MEEISFLTSPGSNRPPVSPADRPQQAAEQIQMQGVRAPRATDRPDLVPLSYSQERLWFIDQLSGTVAYHLPVVLRIKGAVDSGLLEQGFLFVMERHEVLRTVIRQQDEPYQHLLEGRFWKMQQHDMPYEDAGMLEEIQRLITLPFDLAQDYPLRACLIRLGPEDQVLVLVVHHIAADGWSMNILVDELAQYYRCATEGSLPQLPPLPLQYADYAVWQRTTGLPAPLQQQGIGYWQQQLTGVAALQLPADHTRPALQSTRGAVLHFSLEAALVRQLDLLSRQQNATLFMTLLTGFKILLHRYSGQDDICVGSPIAGRQHQELEGLIGLFVNTLALRSNLAGDPSFTALLQQVRETTLQAYEHQGVPFEQVVEAVVRERDTSRNPLFQVLFVWHNTPPSQPVISGLAVHRQTPGQLTSKFDLSFVATRQQEGLQLDIEYSADLFEQATIMRMAAHYGQLLRSAVQGQDQPIGSLAMLTAPEQQQLLHGFNNTAHHYNSRATIVSLFDEQVGRTPHATAIELEGATLSYRELQQHSVRLAGRLRRQGADRGSLVALLVPRSLEMVAGMLGILRAGGAYVPIDVEYPQERIAWMLQDSGSQLVVCSGQSRESVPAPAGVQVVEITLAQAGEEDEIQSEQAVRSEDLAYVIYTSGSTGRPKGVMVEHGSVVNRLLWGCAYFRLGAGQVILHKTPYTFDVSVGEIFSALLSGARLVMARAGGHKDSGYIKELIRRTGVTLCHFVPSVLEVFLAEMQAGECPSVSRVLCSGEALTLSQLRECREKFGGAQVYNLYGPTEAAVEVSCWQAPPVVAGGVLIGRPVWNTAVYILDKWGGVVPVGVAGELCIAGVQVARGYLNQPNLTAEKFTVTTLGGEQQRMYRSGDRARWLKGGEIEYLGRQDEQVKIRGYRIEPGEVEEVLRLCGQVKQAAVVAEQEAGGGRRLVAYVVGAGKLEREEVWLWLKGRLPEYMVPSLLVELGSLPLTGSGKVDRKALASAVVMGEGVAGQQQEYVAAGDATEACLCAVWQQLLGVDRVGVTDNFFRIGGHSLLATRVVSAIRKELQVEVTIQNMFVYPTIVQLAAHLRKEGRTSVASAIKILPRPSQIPLSYSQERLWFIHRLQEDAAYNIPVVWRFKGALNAGALEQALQNLVTRHEVLRTVIREQDGQTYQLVQDAVRWRMNRIEDPGCKDDFYCRQLITELVHQLFNLSEEYMLKAYLLTAGPEDQVLVLVVHHIAADGWSVNILVDELVQYYRCATEGSLPQLPPLPLQYADYAVWQRTTGLPAPLQQQGIGYWQQQLTGVASLQLPADHTRPALQSTRGAVLHFNLEAALVRQLDLLSRQQDVTLFMTLLTGFKILLHRYSGQDDICVGSPIAGRQHQELEGLIGLFVNTLALRSNLAGNPGFTTLLQQLKVTTLQAYEHQGVPFEQVVEAVVRERDTSRNPLFQVLFVWHNTPPSQPAIKGLAVHRQTPGQLTSKFDLSFVATRQQEGLQLDIEYSTDLFEQATIMRMAAHYEQLLRSAVQSPDQPIGSLAMLTAPEQQQLLHGFNHTAHHYNSRATIVSLFDEQAGRTPHATAIELEGATLSYGELQAHSVRLAGRLRRQGAGRGSLVALLVPRSLEMVAGMLGILRAGGAYVPIDVEYPQERIAWMLQDSGSQLVVCSGQSREQAPAGVKVVEIMLEQAGEEEVPEDVEMQSREAVRSEDLAYVIYTSGSTGRPKGVMVEHGSVVNRLLWGCAYFGLGAGQVILHKTPYTFDVSVGEIFSALLSGARLVMARAGGHKDSGYIKELIRRTGVTLCHFVPSVLEVFLAEMQAGECPSVSRVLCSGEALTPVQLRECREKFGGAQVYNLYGPTEAAVEVSCWQAPPVVAGGVLIGRPVWNTAVYILDKWGGVVPVGVAGELCIAGVQVARGYLNQPNLTAEKFTVTTLGGEQQRMYRSGDRARWLKGGEIEYLGRQDEQVKIRGYRIEPGEVEEVLRLCGQVKQAAVVAEQEAGGGRRLVAYVVGAGKLEREEVWLWLKGRLPEYMVPSLLVELGSLPLTGSGKVDRKALASAVVMGEVVAGQQQEYVAAGDATEACLCAVWQQLLGVDRVGVTDNFFRIGGHSLLATRVVSAIRKELQVEISIRLFFQLPTIKSLAKYISVQLNDLLAEEENEVEIKF